MARVGSVGIDVLIDVSLYSMYLSVLCMDVWMYGCMDRTCMDMDPYQTGHRQEEGSPQRDYCFSDRYLLEYILR